MNIHQKGWCWSWSSSTLATWCEEPTHWKDPDSGKNWGQEEKGATEDGMVGWHQWLNGHEFEQTLGIGEGRGCLACCSPLVTNGQTWLSDWTTTTAQYFMHKHIFNSKGILCNYLYFLGKFISVFVYWLVFSLNSETWPLKWTLKWWNQFFRASTTGYCYRTARYWGLTMDSGCG